MTPVDLIISPHIKSTSNEKDKIGGGKLFSNVMDIYLLGKANIPSTKDKIA